MKSRVLFISLVILVTLLVVAVAFASNPKIATGDSRNVTQPTYPSICTALSAQGTSSSGPDQTSQITSSLSSCAGKGSVVLQSSGSHSYFWAKSFTMSSNQTLVIDAGVTLQASSISTQFISLTSGSSNVAILGGQGSPMAVIDGHSSSGNRVISTVNSHSNFTIYNVNFLHSGYPSIYIKKGNGATVWGVQVHTKANTSNADCVDIDSTTNATVTNSFLECGDDGVALKTNANATSNITVENSSFHGSHGMSIGSETNFGVSNALFQNNYIYGQDEFGNFATDDNGIRIKTNSSCGGHVDTITYLNTCMTGVKHLLIFNPNYDGDCSSGSGTPWFTNIVVNGVFATNSVSGAYSEYDGNGSSHVMTLWLENVSLDKTTQSSASYANVGLFNSNVAPHGTGVTTYAFSGNGNVPACSF